MINYLSIIKFFAATICCVFQFVADAQQRTITDIACSNDFLSVYHYDGSLSTDPFGNYLGLIKYRNTSSGKLEYYILNVKQGNTIKKYTIDIPSIKGAETIYAYPRAPFVVIGIRKRSNTMVYFYEHRTNNIIKTVTYSNKDGNAIFDFVINGRSYQPVEFPGYWRVTVENRKKPGVEIDYKYVYAGKNYNGKWKTYFDFLSRDFEINYYLDKLQLIRFSRSKMYLYELDINPSVISTSGLKIYNIPDSDNKSPDFAMARKDNNFFVTFFENTASGRIEIYRYESKSRVKFDNFWIFPSSHLSEQDQALHKKKTEDYFQDLNVIYMHRILADKVFSTNKGYFTYDFVYKVSIPYEENGQIKYRSEAKIYRIKSGEEIELGPLYEMIGSGRREKIKYEFSRKIEIEG